MAGVSVAAVQDAERGRDSRGSTLNALARLYGVPMDSFWPHDPEADSASTGRGENAHDDGARRDALAEVGAAGATGG